MKAIIYSSDGETTLAPYLSILCLDYVLQMSIELIKENGFILNTREAEYMSQKL